MSLTLPTRLPEWVIDQPVSSRAVHPVDEGYVEDEVGVRVFYEVYGDSPDVVCLLQPWALFHLRSWRGALPYLARHFRVLAIDPRGNGRSDRPTHAAAYSRAAHVADVLAVLDATHTSRAMVVGASPRAALALALAVEHPERVRAVVFITPQLWIEEGFARPFAGSRRESYEGMEKFSLHYWKHDYRGFVEWFARWTAPHPHSTRQIELTVEQGLETGPEALIPATVGFEMYEREEALQLARQIRCPVLVTQNGGQAMYPKHTSGPLAEATGGRLHVFEGLGPVVGARWPVAMNLVLREFLESVRAGDAEAQEEAVA